MIADFYDTFEETPDKGSDIPQEVLDILSKELPSTFMYYRNENGDYVAGPRPDNTPETILLKVDLDSQFIEDNLKGIPKEKWAEYLYRMQLCAPIKNAKIGDNENQMPIEKTFGNPFKEIDEIKNGFMSPQPFPPAQKIVFETIEGDILTISIRRQPHPNFDEEVYANIDWPSIQIRIILTETNKKEAKATFSITPQKANTVSDALSTIHFINGLSNGTIKINGKTLINPLVSQNKLDAEQLKNAEEFWSTAQKLEDILGVSFIPSAEMPMEDVIFFAQLKTCLIANKSIGWEHPFDHFHIGEIKIKDPKLEDSIEKENVNYEFIEGPIHATLLGAKFDLYSDTKLINMVITNIVWDNDNKNSGEVYVSDPIGSKWRLYRKYMTTRAS